MSGNDWSKMAWAGGVEYTDEPIKFEPIKWESPKAEVGNIVDLGPSTGYIFDNKLPAMPPNPMVKQLEDLEKRLAHLEELLTTLITQVYTIKVGDTKLE